MERLKDRMAERQPTSMKYLELAVELAIKHIWTTEITSKELAHSVPRYLLAVIVDKIDRTYLLVLVINNGDKSQLLNSLATIFGT